MQSLIMAVLVTILLPTLIIMYNRQRVKGKLFCHYLRKDKSIAHVLCELRGAFVIWKMGMYSRAYDVYPDMVRLGRYPMGWPKMLQELVPEALYDEDDAIPKDWVNLEAPKEGSMKLHAAQEERWVQKVSHEVSASETGQGFNWRKVLPILLLIVGVGGLILVLTMKGCKIG